MQHYDLSYLISPRLDDAKARELHQKILQTLQEEGAVLGNIGDLSKMALVYPIQKQKEAYFAWIRFFLKKEKINNVLSKLSSQQDDFLRFILAKKHEPKKKIRRRQKPYAVIKAEPIVKREKVKLAEVEKKLDEIL